MCPTSQPMSPSDRDSILVKLDIALERLRVIGDSVRDHERRLRNVEGGGWRIEVQKLETALARLEERLDALVEKLGVHIDANGAARAEMRLDLDGEIKSLRRFIYAIVGFMVSVALGQVYLLMEVAKLAKLAIGGN